MAVKHAYARAIDRYLNSVSQTPLGGLVAHDPEDPSPCEIGPSDDNGMVRWWPVPMASAPEFRVLERALGGPVHPDVREFYSSFWAGSVQSKAFDELVVLCGAWSDRLLRAHLQGMAKDLRLRAFAGGAPVIMVASTDSAAFFGVHNLKGCVVLQEAEAPTTRTVAPSLENFLSSL